MEFSKGSANEILQKFDKLLFKKIESGGQAFFLILTNEIVYKTCQFSAYDAPVCPLHVNKLKIHLGLGKLCVSWTLCLMN